MTNWRSKAVARIHLSVSLRSCRSGPSEPAGQFKTQRETRQGKYAISCICRERNIGAALEDGLRDRRGTDVIERTECLCARNENTATEKPSPSKGVAEDSFDRDRVAGLECREPSPRCSKGRPNKTVTRVPPQTCHSRTDAPVEPSMAGFVTPVGWPVGAIVMMPPKSFDPGKRFVSSQGPLAPWEFVRDGPLGSREARRLTLRSLVGARAT